MTALSGHSEFDRFLLTPLMESNGVPLTVLSMLARQDIDPIEEAARLSQLPNEAAINSLDLAFDRFRAPDVVAVTALGNLPSQGLMVRLGMIRREDLDFVDERFPADSEVNPQIVFRIDAADWPKARAALV